MKILIAAVAAALLLCACGKADAPPASHAPDSASGSLSQEERAPDGASEEAPLLGDFTAVDLDGNEVSAEILAQADLTMINIWGTFCGPCLEEMPDLGKLHAQYKDQGVQIVGIVIDALAQDGTYSPDIVDAAKEIAEKTGASYLHLLPSPSLIDVLLGDVVGVPETVFVDKNGSLVGKTYTGMRSGEEWDKIIGGNLKEVAAS